MKKIDKLQLITFLAGPATLLICSFFGVDIAHGNMQIVVIISIIVSLFSVILSIIRPIFEMLIFVKRNDSDTYTEHLSGKNYIFVGIFFIFAVIFLITASEI